MAEVVEPQEDLRGSLRTTSIVDVLQFLHVGGRTGALDLTGQTAGETSRLFLSHGHVTHVELGAVSGIDALAALIGWQGGSFRFTPNVMCAVVSIEEPFQAALMEAIRRHDERTERGLDRGELAAAEIARFVEQTGVLAAALLTAEGQAEATSGAVEKLDLERLAAAAVALAAAARGLAAEVEGGRLKEFFLASDHQEVLVEPVADRLLLVLVGSGAQLGVVRHKIRRLVERLGLEA